MQDYNDYGQEADLGDKGFDSFFRRQRNRAYNERNPSGSTYTRGGSAHANDEHQHEQRDFFWVDSNGSSSTDSTSNKRPSRVVDVGQDLRLDLEIDYATSILGGEAPIRIKQKHTCNTCSGFGVKLGMTQVGNCHECSGTGSTIQQASTPFGIVSTQQTCPSCRGSGHHVNDCCSDCRGMGSMQQERHFMVTIPPRVETGNMLCVKGEGDVGKYGGPSGDLYIFLTVKEIANEKSDEEEDTIVHQSSSEEAIDYVDAMLRATIEAAIMDLKSGKHQWHNATTVHP